MAAIPKCLNCGGANVIPARLHEALTVHLELGAEHAIRRAAIETTLCPDCGFLALGVVNLAEVLAANPAAQNRVVQHEDF